MAVIKDNTGSFMPFNNFSYDAVEGKHSAVIAASVDLEPEDFQGDGDFKEKIALCYQLEGVGSDGFDRIIPVKYTASLNEKSTLYKHMDDAELLAGLIDAGRDTDSLVGKHVKLKLVLKESKKGHHYPVVKQVSDDDNDIQPTWQPKQVSRDTEETKTPDGENIPF